MDVTLQCGDSTATWDSSRVCCLMLGKLLANTGADFLLLLLLLLCTQGAPHPPSTCAGGVGWRVMLYWPADGMWHEAEVINHNEVRVNPESTTLNLDSDHIIIGWPLSSKLAFITCGRQHSGRLQGTPEGQRKPPCPLARPSSAQL